jgi:hypothetical protein
MPTGYHKNPADDMSRTELMLSGLKRQCLSIHDADLDRDYIELSYDIYDRVKYERRSKYVSF